MGIIIPVHNYWFDTKHAGCWRTDERKNCILFYSTFWPTLILYSVYSLLAKEAPSLCPIWLLLCPRRVFRLLAGWRAECRVKIREPPELQTNTSHWPGAPRDLWPAADRWPARPSRPLHISTLDVPGWGRVRSDFAVNSVLNTSFISADSRADIMSCVQTCSLPLLLTHASLTLV